MSGAVANLTIAEAAEHYNAGRVEQAGALCGDVLKADPDHIQALNLAALIAFVSDRAAEGAALLNRVFSLEPNNARAFITLGDALAVKGEHEGAADAFQRALMLQPRDAGLHAKLADVLYQLKRFDEAEVVYRHAIELNPDLTKARFALANMLMQQGQSIEAAEFYRALIAREPDQLAALFNLGNILVDRGEYGEAIGYYRRIITLNPGFAAGYRHLALALTRDKQCADALAVGSQVMVLEPENVENHIVMGEVLLALDQIDDAVNVYRQALALRSDLPKLHCDLAVALHRKGETEEAVQAYRRAAELAPQDAAIFKSLGIVLQHSNRPEESLQAYRQGIALDPNDADILVNLGTTLYNLGRAGEAFDAFQRALALSPENAAAHNNLGLYHDGEDTAEGGLAAVAAYRRAVASNPNFAQAHSNLGQTLGYLGQIEEGIAASRRAVEICPDNPLYHYNYAHALLGSGDFANGFREYEWRIKHHIVHDGTEVFAGPQWQGEPLNGRTLLLRAEYGLGDVLHFVRYAPMAAARGGPVVLQVQPALVDLLRGSLPDITIVPRGEPLPPFDLHLPLLSLAHIFGTTLETVPAEVPYLAADPAKLARWQRAMRHSTQLKVGVNWAGNPKFKQDRRRSLSAELVLPHLLVPGVQLFSLQKEWRETDHQVMEAMKDTIINLAPTFADFSDTAAAMSALDLIITTDTSVAHLAGALGRPTWVMLPYALDWRWLHDREDCPWYPTMRLFRQRKPYDWQSVFERLPGELARVAAGERHPLLP